MSWVVFDGDGKAWTNQLPNPWSRARLPISGEEYLDYLLINMGYVYIRQAPHGSIVRLRPKVAAQAAVAATLYQLMYTRPPRLLASVYEGRTWHNTMFIDDRDTDASAVSVFLRHVARWPENADRDIIHCRRSAQSLAFDSPLRGMLSLWQDQTDPAQLAAHLHSSLGGRYAWMEQTDQSEPLRLTMIGSGFPDRLQPALQASIGKPLHEIVGQSYGRYCDETYSTVLRTMRPIREDVDALF
jgi:hypothetical protein